MRGARPPSERTARGAPHARRGKRKVGRPSRDSVARFKKSFGAALGADPGSEQSLAMAHPDAVCSLLQTLHLGPHLCPPPSRPSPRGRFKGARVEGGGVRVIPMAPGLPAAISINAPRSPPGHCGRGRTASRGGEPEVRGGAPGNPSPSEPGGAGGRGRAGGARGGSGARGAGGRGGGRRGRTAREAPPPPPGARSPPPPPPLSPLTLPLASGRRPGCVHRGPVEPCPRRLG